ncbi:MAG: argininosuccinate synthase [Dehalococcoidia bacterium]
MNWKELSQTQDYVFAGAVSGGLDSCTVAHWLSAKDVDVHCFTVDLGQPDEKKLDDVSTRMLGSGAKSSNILDGKNDLAEAGLKVIQSQARYEGGYWNTTGIARPVTVQQILPEMKKQNIDVLFHGATGRGNDQVRFQLASNMINPNVKVYAPWRDQEFLQQFPGRQQMLDYCEINSIPIKPSKESRYSTDANFLGLTHEAGDLENISISPDFVETIMGEWPWNAKENPDYVTIKWDKGVPVEINGTQLSLVDAFTTANKIAGDHGVGIGTHVIENRFVGIKSRGIYESPGMELLGQSYEFLLQFILDRRSRELFSDLSSTISRQIYQGYWLDLSTSMSLKSLDLITQFATGTIQVKLYKGGVYFDSADDSLNSMPHSLYTNDGSMEDEGGYDHSDAEGFLNVLGVSAKNFGEKFKNLRS